MKGNKLGIILSEATHIMGQKGYSGTSFQEIADKVGIHKSTLFHYFSNKEEMLLLILEKPIKEVYANLEQIITSAELRPEEKLEKAIKNHLAMLVEYIDNVNVYLNEFGNLSKKNQAIYLRRRKKYECDFNKIITEMKAVGYFDRLDVKIITFGILGMLNWTVKWFKNEGPLGTDKVANIFVRMVT